MNRRTPDDRAHETRALLRWYDQRLRDLPWRRSRNPYRVWVSEIMLQQTRVATALPYYEDFVERFPTIHDLAAAEVDEVLALWSGLGYYRRARQLHTAAVTVSKTILQEGGTFPQTAESLRRLPGIGPYTAAAIASICFDEAIPVIDGNVERVLARRLQLRENVKHAAPRHRLLAAAAELLDPERPGDTNQALMELGATVCMPRSPNCGGCPLSAGCLGRAEPERYPAPRARRSQVQVTVAVAVVRRGGHRGAVLLFRRHQDDDLLAGLWELPHVEVPSSSAGSADPKDIAADLSQQYGGTWRLEPEACRLRHSITHRSLMLCVHPATLEDGGEVAERSGPEAAWVAWQDESHRFATSSMVGKVIDTLAKNLH